MTNGDINISINALTQNLQKGLSGAKKQINMFGKTAQGVFANLKKTMQSVGQSVLGVRDSFRTAMKGSSKSVDKTTDAMNRQRKGFPAWALSIMFFGMMLKRVFDTIWRSSTQTFRDVMHSVEGTTTSFDKLEGAMTWLKFVAGQALEPLAEAFTPIILAVADWISENEELFRSLMLITGILGVFFLGVGQLALGLAAVKSLFTSLIKPIAKFAWWVGKGVVKAVTWLVRGFSASALVIGLVIWYFIELLLEGLKDWRARWEDTVETFKLVFKHFTNFFKHLINGEWREAIKSIGAIYQEIFKWIGRVIIRNTADSINALINMFNRVAKALGFSGTSFRIDSEQVIRTLGINRGSSPSTDEPMSPVPPMSPAPTSDYDDTDIKNGGWLEALKSIGSMDTDFEEVMRTFERNIGSLPSTDVPMSPVPSMSPASTCYYGDTVINIDSTMSGSTEFTEFLKTFKRMQ